MIRAHVWYVVFNSHTLIQNFPFKTKYDKMIKVHMHEKGMSRSF